MAILFRWHFYDNVDQPMQRLCDHKTTALCWSWKRRLPAWNRQAMPDVVAGKHRCIQICQQDDHWVGERGWSAPRVWLGTGSWQDTTASAVEAAMPQFRKAAREGGVLSSMAQILKRSSKTLRMMARGNRIAAKQSTNNKTVHLKSRGPCYNVVGRVSGSVLWTEVGAWRGWKRLHWWCKILPDLVFIHYWVAALSIYRRVINLKQ